MTARVDRGVDADRRACGRSRIGVSFMDVATSLGLVAGGVVLASLILMGGDVRMFLDTHAAIVILGGSFAATLIRFPFSSIMHGLPLGARYAFGMIGTLIGMVQMFANMTDPSKLGPYMAVALLATFYGAAVANLFCLPIADKLHLKLVDEEINRTLVIDGVLMIRDAKSPTLVREMLLAYLPEKHRHQEGDPETVPAAAPA